MVLSLRALQCCQGCRRTWRHCTLSTTVPAHRSWRVPALRPWASAWSSRCQQVRSLKTKTTISVEDLPQGMLSEPEELKPPLAQPELVYPTVIQQARNNMRKFENCVVLTRVGGFYELYFEQAEKFGPLLNLKVGKKLTAVGPVPMAGFPFFQLDRFLRSFIQDLSQAVAIAEEFPNDPSSKTKSGGLLFDRRVARVVTPGTLVDEKFMNPYENNFLLAIHAAPERPSEESEVAYGEANMIGLAWVDLSTGEFFTQGAPRSNLASAITRIGAKEIVIESSSPEANEALEAVAQTPIVQWECSNNVSTTKWPALFDGTVSDMDGAELSASETNAALLLLSYVSDRLQGLSAKLQPPVQWHGAENMGIDANTMKGLEILETSKEAISGGKGSLLHSLRRTVSSGGARLLRSRLSSPSTSLSTINHRLDLVQYFLEHGEERIKLAELLKETFDTQRLVQKFSLGRGDADDLVSLYKTISATRNIKALLEECVAFSRRNESDQVFSRSLEKVTHHISMDGPDVLSARIAESIDEDGLLEHHRNEEARAAEALDTARDVMSSQGGEEDLNVLPRTAKGKSANPTTSIRAAYALQPESWKMRRTASDVLGKLHLELDVLVEQRSDLETELQETSQASSLSLRWTPGQGHICHVKGAKDVKLSTANLPSARSAGSSKTTRSFYHPRWTKLGNQIDQQRLRIIAEEDHIFGELRDAVVQNLVRLRRNATVLDELDVACASAVLAEEEGLVRPILDNGTSHRVIGGRHATVKLGLDEDGRAFVSNNCSIGSDEHVWLITGPNMAGKSTFLRQNALISILAQVGLFVPAAHAEMGIVDHVFSRIGSADNLYRDQSTFMVEMLESAHILRTATPRSLVIMDEIGRGTTPEDGVAVAFACLHHLYHVNRCRTLFATHFHALADMTADWDRLGRYCTEVVETNDGGFHYDYRLRRGVNRHSHALKVARLAGIPPAALDVAQRVLEHGAPTSASLETPLPPSLAASG